MRAKLSTPRPRLASRLPVCYLRRRSQHEDLLFSMFPSCHPGWFNMRLCAGSYATEGVSVGHFPEKDFATTHQKALPSGSSSLIKSLLNVFSSQGGGRGSSGWGGIGVTMRNSHVSLCPQWWKFERFFKWPGPPRLDLWLYRKGNSSTIQLELWSTCAAQGATILWWTKALAGAERGQGSRLPLALRLHIIPLLSTEELPDYNYTAGTVHHCTLECERRIWNYSLKWAHNSYRKIILLLFPEIPNCCNLAFNPKEKKKKLRS